MELDDEPCIVDKLAALRERPPDTFGAERHHFELAPPTGEAAVRALERQLGVELPEELGLFLAVVGASGAGPYYGLLPADRQPGPSSSSWPKRP